MTRNAGPIAIVAGVLFAALDLGRLPIAAAEHRAAALRDPLIVTVNAAYFFGFCALLIALVAGHGRQSRQAGAFGAVAFGAVAFCAVAFCAAPTPAALGLMVAGLIAFRSSFPPYGMPLGLVVAALGGWLIRSGRAVATAAAASR